MDEPARIQSESPEPEFLTAREVSLLLRASKQKIYQLAAKGQIPCVLVGSSYRFPADALRAWVRMRLSRKDSPMVSEVAEAEASFEARRDDVQRVVLGALHGYPLNAGTLHALAEVLGALMYQRVTERHEALAPCLQILLAVTQRVASAVPVDSAASH
jgi:excisionase family DNA binding protein